MSDLKQSDVLMSDLEQSDILMSDLKQSDVLISDLKQSNPPPPRPPNCTCARPLPRRGGSVQKNCMVGLLHVVVLYYFFLSRVFGSAYFSKD